MGKIYSVYHLICFYFLKYAEFFRLPAKADDFARQPTKFWGSELREENGAELVQVALATEGVSLSSKDLLTSSIVSSALGTGPRVKHSSGANKLAKAIAAVASQPAMASTFSAKYSDAGLFGIHIVGSASDIGKVSRTN